MTRLTDGIRALMTEDELRAARVALGLMMLNALRAEKAIEDGYCIEVVAEFHRRCLRYERDAKAIIRSVQLRINGQE